MSKIEITTAAIDKVVLELEPHEARGLKTLLCRGVAAGAIAELTLGGLLSDLLYATEIVPLPTKFQTITVLED